MTKARAKAVRNETERMVTLAKDEPFTFLDHALKTGDSLVGLDLDQLRSFHWKAGKQLELGEKFLEKALGEALKHREQILKMAVELEAPGPTSR